MHKLKLSEEWKVIVMGSESGEQMEIILGTVWARQSKK